MSEIVPVDPLPLVDLDTARGYLKTPDTNQFDETIKLLIDHASAQIGMHTRRYLLARDYDSGSAVAGHRDTLILDGTGNGLIYFPEYPVNSVSSILERYPDGTTTRTLNITGLRKVKGHGIYLPYDSFGRSLQNIEVKCNLGYAAGTHDRERRALEAIACRWVQVLWQDRDAAIGRGTSFGVGGDSVQLISTAIPPDVEKALAPFVRWV